MVLVGVWVNEKCLPTRQNLINAALTSLRFYNKKNALQLIEKEIDKSGLFERNIENVEPRSSGSGNASRRPSNSKKKSNTRKGKGSNDARGKR